MGAEPICDGKAIKKETENANEDNHIYYELQEQVRPVENISRKRKYPAEMSIPL